MAEADRSAGTVSFCVGLFWAVRDRLRFTALRSASVSSIDRTAGMVSKMSVVPYISPKQITTANGAIASTEDQLLERLVDRLNMMGMIPGPHPRQQDEPWEEPDGQAFHDQQWGQSWDSWQTRPGMSSCWSSWLNWKKHDWIVEEKHDRPYISPLDFPKFDGRREEYSICQYAVIN